MKAFLWMGPLAVLLAATLASAQTTQPFDVELAQSGVSFLSQYCKRCHGDDDAYPGLDVADRATLLKPVIDDEDPFIVPGSAKDSRLWDAVDTDYMPPEDQPQPTPEEFAAFTKWIDAGAPFPPARRVEREFLGEATLLAMIADDLEQLTDEQIRATRYFSLAHLWNDTGGREPTTAEDLRMTRAAVSKLVNSLSNKSRIVPPRIVDQKFGTLLAIDMRDYGWDAWHWSQILTSYPYGLKTGGGEAAKIYRLTETKTPYLRADWFVNNASRPPLYHELLGIPKNAKALETQLGVDIRQNFQAGQLARAAFQQSGVSDQNRMVERHDTTGGGRYYWKSYDIKPGAGERGDFSRRPLGPEFEGLENQLAAFDHDGGEIIYSLANGLQAYMLVDGEDVRINIGPSDVVEDKNRHAGNSQIVNGLSCMGCHKQGMILWEKDTVRPLFESRRGQQVADKVLQLFPPNEQMLSLVKGDRDHFLLALAQAVGPFLQIEDDADKEVSEFPDPITKTAKRYLRDLTAADAARELGIQEAKLVETAAGLPRLRQLGLATIASPDGVVSRETWESVYGSAARELGLGTPVRHR